MALFQYKLPLGTSLQDLMDDIGDALNATMLINPDRKLEQGEASLSLAGDNKHGMGIFEDGVRFDIYLFNISSSLEDGVAPSFNHTMVDVGVHLDLLASDDISNPQSNSFKINVRAKGRPQIAMLIPENVRLARGMLERGNAQRDQDTGRMLESEVPTVRQSLRGVQTIEEIFTPRHQFG